MAHDILFEPVQMGEQTLKNRIMMAPLTRLRAVEPGDEMFSREDGRSRHGDIGFGLGFLFELDLDLLFGECLLEY